MRSVYCRKMTSTVRPQRPLRIHSGSIWQPWDTSFSKGGWGHFMGAFLVWISLHSAIANDISYIYAIWKESGHFWEDFLLNFKWCMIHHPSHHMITHKMKRYISSGEMYKWSNCSGWSRPFWQILFGSIKPTHSTYTKTTKTVWPTQLEWNDHLWPFIQVYKITITRT